MKWLHQDNRLCNQISKVKINREKDQLPIARKDIQ